MSLRVVLRNEAEAELNEAFDFYEGRRRGLGSEFVLEVQHAFDLIAGQPLAYRIVLADVRQCVVRRFPYCVYYRAHAARIEVISVFHTSRDPMAWRSRG